MSASSDGGIDLQLRLGFSGFTLELEQRWPGRGVTALYGPSGSGKTSCLRAIAGLQRARGRVLVNGEIWQDDARGILLPTHQRALGYVFQEASLFTHLTVRGNVEYGPRRTAPAQRRVPLDQAIELLGIGQLLERAPATLSGGERQRVAIARALATSPRVLLMDEPLAALDAARKADILPYLERLHAELSIPVLYVSHALDEVARLADHVVLLDGGRVAAAGATGEMLTRLDLPLAHGDAAGALVHATVVSHDDAYHLTLARFAGGTFSVPRQPLPVGAPLRVRVQARDVSITLERQVGTSILNILPATVSGIAPDSPGQVMVRMDAGGTPLLARITARSADALALAPGKPVHAQVKGVAIWR